MAKRLRSPDRVDGGKRPRHGRKHLYVVLDDRQNGYSIHKVDADANGVGLTDPPLLRLDSLGEASRGVLVGALGSKILALWQPTADGQLTTHAVAYGTDTDKLAVGPPHPDALLTMRFVVAAGERLYALHEGGLHCLELVLDETLPSGAEDSEAEELQEHRWAWTRVSSPLRLPGCDGDIPEEEDEPIEITSYALHPDGRTIFVSAHATRRGGYAGTFSLDTALGGGDAEWTPRGEWLLPFQGQGHYDAGLDAWVGLHSPGYLCACDVPALRRRAAAADLGARERGQSALRGPRPEDERLRRLARLHGGRPVLCRGVHGTGRSRPSRTSMCCFVSPRSALNAISMEGCVLRLDALSPA